MGMSKTGKAWLWTIVAVLIIGGGITWLATRPSTPPPPGQYDDFAKCLTEKKATFYGAFWCSHCQNQKKEFGDSMKYVTYVECSTADGKNQTQICKDNKIEGYPTWVFADGSRQDGEVSFEKLAEKTGCTLPSANTNQTNSANSNQSNTNGAVMNANQSTNQ